MNKIVRISGLFAQGTPRLLPVCGQVLGIRNHSIEPRMHTDETRIRRDLQRCSPNGGNLSPERFGLLAFHPC